MSEETQRTQNRSRTSPNPSLLETPSTYTVDGKAFIVTPVFREKEEHAVESLGSVLLNLMRNDL